MKNISLLPLIFAFSLSGFSQIEKVDINMLTQETQKMSQSAEDLTLVWWIPEEFWRVSFEQDPSITKFQIEEFLKVLNPYTLVVALDGKIGTMGGINYKSNENIKYNISVVDNEGTQYRPLIDESIDADTKNFLSMMKPMFVNMLGSMGENMNFFVFPSKDGKGKNFADAMKEGSFTVKLYDKDYRWRLPLGSLLPLKVCPIDHEKLNGSWKFCPWHGVELK